MRMLDMEYPDYSAEIEAIEENGITSELLERIIFRHEGNAQHSRELYGRYRTQYTDVPIFQREPRFADEEDPVNNKINNDYFSEICNTKIGYFSGKAANYSYEEDRTAVNETGGDEAVDEAIQTLSEFIKRNNMFEKNMESTKFASICGYTGRLFYVDKESNERVKIIPPYECIILSKDEMTNPQYAVRYYPFMDLNDTMSLRVEFYDDTSIYYYSGQKNALAYDNKKLHLFDYCPLQGIPNNAELMGDAEKQIALIDDQDQGFSDDSNDIESFASAYMLFDNATLGKNTSLTQSRRSGVIEIEPVIEGADHSVGYLTKNIDGSLTNSHLDRGRDNIYRFSQTPNLNDPQFNAVSGIALKIKMTGLEQRTGSFEAKQLSADTYMFKLLASSYKKKAIAFDPMQCTVKYNRNFPVDFLGEAQAVQALIAAGLPKKIAFQALSFVDDIDYVMGLIEEERQAAVPDLDEEDTPANQSADKVNNDSNDGDGE